MKKNVLIFGGIAGLIVAVFMLVSVFAFGHSDTTDYTASMVVNYTGQFLAFTMIFVGIKNYRDKYNSGVITFGKAFKTGFLIALIASSVYVLTWLINYYTFMPNFIDDYAQSILKSTPPADLQKAKDDIEMMRKIYSTPFGIILATYFEVLPMGLLISLASALILKRKVKTIAGA